MTVTQQNAQRILIFNTYQVRFSLSSSPVFSRSDTITDSERFYNSVMELFDDPEELEEVNEVLVWWNRYALLRQEVFILMQRLLQANLPTPDRETPCL